MNYEMERTEELIVFAQQKKRKKQRLIAAISIAVVAIVGGITTAILIHNNTQNEKVDKLMLSAQKNLEEGKYEQAKKDFDEIIKLDDSNAKAYEGRGDAKVKTAKTPDDYRDAVADYDKAYENTDKDDSNRIVVIDKGHDAAEKSKDPKLIKKYENLRKKEKTKNSVNDEYPDMGNTPEGIAAGGIVCEKDGEFYVANNPKRGQISKVDSNGKVIETVFEYKDLGSTEYISRLNVWDGWIYYALMTVETDKYDTSREIGQLRRVKIDGTKDEEIEGMVDQEIYSLAIIKGKFYYTEDVEEGVYALNEIELDGSKKKNICKDVYFGNTFTADGENIICNIESKLDEDEVTPTCDLVKRNINNLDTTSVIKKKQGGIHKIVQSGGKIYYAENYNGAPDSFSIVDISDNKLMEVKDLWEEEIIISAVNASKENAIIVSDYSYDADEEERQNNGYVAKFYFVNSINGILDASKNFKLKIEDSDIVNLEAASLEYIYVLNDKIYYQVLMGHEEIPLFGVVSIDGKDNNFYGKD